MSSFRHIGKHPNVLQLEACKTLKQIKQIHTQMLINGLFKDPKMLGQFVSSIALKQPNYIDYSIQVLQHWKRPSLVALNSLMRAHCLISEPCRSFYFYNRIVNSDHNLRPDKYTFTFLIKTCSQLFVEKTSLAVYGCVLKYGFDVDPYVRSSLVSMFAELGLLGFSKKIFLEMFEPDFVTQTAMVSAGAKLGDLVFARELFDRMPTRDLATWNAMMAGYAECGKAREVFDLFRLMQFAGVKVNEASVVLFLSACTQLGALDHGRWAHDYIEECRLRMGVALGSALVDMYAKCGDVDKAMEVFWSLKEKNVYTWTSAMGGLAMNGFGNECLELFAHMKHEGVEPNEVTFVSLLKGCSVVGLVEEGQRYFELMRKVYGLQPSIEHYGCMVDLYSRAGRLDEAFSFINSMPIKPHVDAWGALLNACKIYKNKELGELAFKKIRELKGNDHGTYLLLSNIYAETKNWSRVENVRRAMNAREVSQVTKVRCCSVIEVNGEVHGFFGGDKSHPRQAEIEEKMAEMSQRLKLAGYVANNNPVLFDIEEEEKENTACEHSEKVAIAFGLISLNEGAPIRIVKNLRVCSDCHVVTKLISKMFDREIIVRDRNRLHHFKDGECSCNGCW
ncbi:Pentatricopeptide repeat-containing protein [Heracleum sosnowskyi]|uniref:Pentatricopeptide repeat-containing protein n=1 Tax=Heracleum sosnowskyi TaxID=360622 RepID=A0AAD8J035_9APIA|nr:Pentatricopeptide repeat-containing protein [Heracleum sosnowskyi]